MVHIPEIANDTLKVSVRKKPLVLGPFVPWHLVVRHAEGRVHLFVNDKRVDMNTVTAHRIGLSLAQARLAPDEMSVLDINGERIDLVGPLALKLAAGLLRKADEADDWQLNRNRRKQNVG